MHPHCKVAFSTTNIVMADKTFLSVISQMLLNSRKTYLGKETGKYPYTMTRRIKDINLSVFILSNGQSGGWISGKLVCVMTKVQFSLMLGQGFPLHSLTLKKMEKNNKFTFWQYGLHDSV